MRATERPAANTRPGIGVTELTSPVSSSTRMSTLTKPLKRSELVSRNRSVETAKSLSPRSTALLMISEGVPPSEATRTLTGARRRLESSF